MACPNNCLPQNRCPQCDRSLGPPKEALLAGYRAQLEASGATKETADRIMLEIKAALEGPEPPSQAVLREIRERHMRAQPHANAISTGVRVNGDGTLSAADAKGEAWVSMPPARHTRLRWTEQVAEVARRDDAMQFERLEAENAELKRHLSSMNEERRALNATVKSARKNEEAALATARHQRRTIEALRLEREFSTLNGPMRPGAPEESSEMEVGYDDPTGEDVAGYVR